MINEYINNIPKTYFGRRSINCLDELSESKILVIYSKSLEGNGEFSKIMTKLENKVVIKIVPGGNIVREIEGNASKVKDIGLIIAIGGGNILDFSKLLRLKLDNPKIILKDVNMTTKLHSKTLLYVIPSTPSTGSQVTPIAITHNKDDNGKLIVLNSSLTPDLVILSPKILLSLSKNQMAEFICDIFAHSVEAYISRLTSPLIMDLAEMNVLKLIDNWKSYLEDPENLNILGKIAMNGQIGGICQGNAFVGVMHALTHQIELLTGLGHSRILLNIIRPVLEWYSKNSDLEICEVFMKQFDELKLEEYRENILEDVDLEKLAIKSLEDPSIKTSPVIFNEDKIRGLIKWISTKK